MATMHVSVPDPMKDWVEKKTNSGSYGNVSEFIRDLIRKEQEKESNLADLKAYFQAGIDSGISPRNLDDIWADVKERYLNEQAKA